MKWYRVKDSAPYQGLPGVGLAPRFRFVSTIRRCLAWLLCCGPAWVEASLLCACGAYLPVSLWVPSLDGAMLGSRSSSKSPRAATWISGARPR